MDRSKIAEPVRHLLGPLFAYSLVLAVFSAVLLVATGGIALAAECSSKPSGWCDNFDGKQVDKTRWRVESDKGFIQERDGVLNFVADRPQTAIGGGLIAKDPKHREIAEVSFTTNLENSYQGSETGGAGIGLKLRNGADLAFKVGIGPDGAPIGVLWVCKRSSCANIGDGDYKDYWYDTIKWKAGEPTHIRIAQEADGIKLYIDGESRDFYINGQRWKERSPIVGFGFTGYSDTNRQFHLTIDDVAVEYAANPGGTEDPQPEHSGPASKDVPPKKAFKEPEASDLTEPSSPSDPGPTRQALRLHPERAPAADAHPASAETLDTTPIPDPSTTSPPTPAPAPPAPTPDVVPEPLVYDSSLQADFERPATDPVPASVPILFDSAPPESALPSENLDEPARDPVRKGDEPAESTLPEPTVLKSAEQPALSNSAVPAQSEAPDPVTSKLQISEEPSPQPDIERSATDPVSVSAPPTSPEANSLLLWGGVLASLFSILLLVRSRNELPALVEELDRATLPELEKELPQPGQRAVRSIRKGGATGSAMRRASDKPRRSYVRQPGETWASPSRRIAR